MKQKMKGGRAHIKWKKKSDNALKKKLRKSEQQSQSLSTVREVTSLMLRS